HHADIRLAPSVAEAIESAKESAQPGDIILIAGSIFLAGEAREMLTGR
ncbi:MAG: bifunctional folylpolyglutamate synthase/dihydrofolate synthase, partial [Acidobacteria bacterium]|nr:bifunctional folylpolyglutamate synthase/dihydrofolate synthase [Acidobacteriota bacterium]